MNNKDHPLYSTWKAMRARCRGKYLHKGIKVCKRWNDFWTFVKDMPPRPTRKYSLDRYPNNDGDYKPSNVRWATRFQQQQNTSRSRKVTSRGKTLTLSQWGRLSGIDAGLISNRLASRYSASDAIWTPVVQHKRYKPKGSSPFPRNGRSICRKKGIHIGTVKSRLYRGWTFQKAITIPINRQKGPGNGLRAQ